MDWNNYKFNIGTTVYNWFFDLETENIMCNEYKIESYEYTDGMQWEIIDMYNCSKNILIPFCKVFKKKKKIYHRIPGHLLHTNKEVAKVIFLKEVLKSFGYILKKNGKSLNYNLYNRVIKVKREYDLYMENSPELILKAQVIKLSTELNSNTFWR